MLGASLSVGAVAGLRGHHAGIWRGSSYGAIAALYALLTRPDLFGSGIIESPALQIGNGEMLRNTNPLPHGPVKVFIGIGTAEVAPMPEISAGLVKMAEMLDSNPRAAMFNHPEVMLVVKDGAQHNEQAWAERFPQAIEFSYGIKRAELPAK